MADFKKLKVVELRAELAKRNLPQTGKRDELIERLEEDEFHNADVGEEAISDETVMEVDGVEVKEVRKQSPVSPLVVNSPVSPLVFSSPAHLATPVISPVLHTESITPDTLTIEQEKRRQRALRFGLDADETATVNIEITLKRLEHALPTRSRHNHRNHKNSARINKA